MAVQMYLVVLEGGYKPESSRDVQRYVRRHGGLIMMVTNNGPIVAVDDSKAPLISKHPLVKFMGGVTLNPAGAASDRLQRIFAENLSKQLAFTNPDAKATS